MLRMLLAMTSVALSAPAAAWGFEGHEIIATIARDRLTPAVRDRVDAILAADTDTLTAPDMISRSTWADACRNAGHRETASWHFVDNELAKPDIKTACFGFPTPAQLPSSGPAEDCVVDKVTEFAAELADPGTSDGERLLALKYLLHFVGDLHQPLHAADNQDRGGNCVLVALGGSRTVNLHAYWDTTVVNALGTDPRAVATKLESQITAANVKSWQKGKPADWAVEAFKVAQSTAYQAGSKPGCPSNAAATTLPNSYPAKADAAAALQLKRAGVRLAQMLNGAWGADVNARDRRPREAQRAYLPVDPPKAAKGSIMATPAELM